MNRQTEIKIITSEFLIHSLLQGNPHIESNNIILLAEDDLDDQEMLIEACHELAPQIQFVVAGTGSKALELLKKLSGNPGLRLIVLDYNLPEVSGAEILSRLCNSELFRDIPKLVWSTSNSPVYEKKCMQYGALEYIVKPNGVAGIRAIAKRLVDLCTNR